jgi:hypothetical protein
MLFFRTVLGLDDYAIGALLQRPPDAVKERLRKVKAPINPALSDAVYRFFLRRNAI